MRTPGGTIDDLEAWLRIAERIRSAVRGMSESELDARETNEAWSARELVHHLVEANLVASTMILAALATDGGAFDWSWLQPGGSWRQRVGYDRADVEPALAALRAISRYVAALVRTQPDALRRTVSLSDRPGAPRYSRTIEEILRQEAEHAREHLGELRAARRHRSSS